METVEEEDARVADQRPGDADALALPARHRRRALSMPVCICIGIAAMSRSTAARRAARQASSALKLGSRPMMLSSTVPA